MTLILVLAVILLLPMTFGYNYCNNRTHLCELAKWKHFMCRLEDFHAFGNTKYHAIVPDTAIVRRETLGVINTFRNTFASGDLTTNENKTFSSAKRMRRLNCSSAGKATRDHKTHEWREGTHAGEEIRDNPTRGKGSAGPSAKSSAQY